ncbi:MAG: hypothetical protein MNPFHGCM_00396 [Gemmatimonadaceae bacterium]|nr:hypothetical protein [Gemmatimonadaceae bacterium]
MYAIRQLQLATVAILLSRPTAAATAQDALPTLADVTPRGIVVSRVQSRSDPKATYAVYLPAAFTRDRRWPVVFLMDPRGRALIPVELFQPIAERLGYVLVSSYDTRSDGARDPNDRALDAMLADVQRYLAPDAHRLYLAGFSGTARFAWDVSAQLTGSLAGILGFGAGTPGERQWIVEHVRGTPFDYYGAVGNRDPNYAELRQLQRDLAEMRYPARIEVFDGPHRWPPADLCARALTWMHMRAMQRGLLPADVAWLDSLATERLAESDSRAGTDDLLRLRLLRDWLSDFGSGRDTTAVATRVAQLAGAASVRYATRIEAEWDARERAWMRGFFDFAFALRTSKPELTVGEGKRLSHAGELARLAAGKRDSVAAVAARRAINRIVVYSTFYEFREYEISRRWEQARTLLKVAEDVAPGDASVCFALARAEAQLARHREALDHLDCAVSGGEVSRVSLADPLLAPLRDDPRFGEIVSRLSR